MIQTIINAFGNALSGVFGFVPRLVGFLVILFVGWLIAMAVDKALAGLLRKVGFDRLSQRMGLNNLERRMGMRMDSTQILGRIAFWFIFLIFLVPATDALGLPTVSNTLTGVVDYLPNVFAAILVLFAGTILGVFVGEVAQGTTGAARIGNPRVFGKVVRWAIIGFSCLIALQQLQIAPALITVLFTAIVGALALAFGLAFGLGGREAAQHLLSRSEGQLMAARPYDPTQIVQQARADLTHTDPVGYGSPQAASATPTAYTSTPGTQQAVPPVGQNYEDYDNPKSSPQRPQRPSTPR
ncbi:MAG TPA: hypothetical protein VGD98_22490 [Ktedonobacteraceae bacterium]